jgi:hypothetical protein
MRPTRRYGAAMAYDALHHKIVVFGGVDVATYGDTWLWDGVVWTRHTLSMTAPTPRAGAAMTYDVDHGRVLMFGGFDENHQTLADLWEWDGDGWHELDTTASPAPVARGRASMAYDPRRHVSVMFGGGEWGIATPVDGATWEWDGEHWSMQSPSDGPTARLSPAMTFDPMSDEILLVGGQDDRTTWTWNGTRWAAREVGTAPTQFRDAGLAFDQTRLRPVLYGGLDYPGSNTYGGTWELTATTWSERTAVSAPPPRNSFGMTYVDDIGAVMVFGGFGGTDIRYDDLWSWDGETWQEWR